MSFVVKPVKTKTIGEFLQHCRTRLGLSHSEVFHLCHIQPKYLVAFEEGRFSDLPATVYVKGFLRKLGEIYHIDREKLVQQFLEEQESTSVQVFEPRLEKVKFIFPRFILNRRTLTVGGVVFLAFLGLSYLYFQVSSLKRPPRLEIFAPSADGTVNSSLLLIRGETEQGASLYLNNQAIVVAANGEFRENVSLAPGTNELVIRAVNKFGQETVVNRSVILQEKEIAGSFTGSDSAQIAAAITLEIKIGPQAAWIYLETDGIERYSGTMLPGSIRTVAGREKIVLTTGNAGSTRVLLDRKDLGVLGKEGEVIRDIEFAR